MITSDGYRDFENTASLSALLQSQIEYVRDLAVAIMKMPDVSHNKGILLIEPEEETEIS
jgi:hypothetical protein